MTGQLRLQDPGATLAHPIDWSDWLATGDTIATSTWAVSPSGPTISGQSKTDTATTCKLAGVTFGVVYQLTNTVVSANGETDERSLTVRGAHQ